MADDLLCWPHWLPRPFQSGYSYTLTDTNEVTEMEIGTLCRVVFDVDHLVINCSMKLATCQIAFFETFEHDTLCQGRKWFAMPVWVGGELKQYKVRFKGRPKVGGVEGLNTKVTFSLEMGRRTLPPVNTSAFDRETLPGWPAELPGLQDEGYGYELADRTLESQTSLNTEKRVDFAIDEVRISARMLLLPEEAARFEAFERDVLHQGCRWFRMPVWVAGELREYKVRFRGRPKATEVRGLHTIVTFTLDLEQRSLLDPDLVAWLLYLSPEELYRLADRLCFVMNVKVLGCTTVPPDVYRR